jgi:YHYH protein
MNNMFKRNAFPVFVFCFAIFACQKEGAVVETPTETVVPDVYKKIYGATDISVDGAYVVLKTKCLPDHKSPYYTGTQWADRYEAYNGTNPMFALNPNRIAEQNITFRIPLNPKEAGTKSATPGGPIGISLNGVVFFNQYAAMNAPLTNEINGFDQYGGHPQQQGQYHYHLEPTYLTAAKGKSALLGFLLDGFPVYGPVENGKTLVSADLDKYHGHTHATTDYPNGIYHYHFTADGPYLNGDGFFGTPGTVSR